MTTRGRGSRGRTGKGAVEDVDSSVEEKAPMRRKSPRLRGEDMVGGARKKPRVAARRKEESNEAKQDKDDVEEAESDGDAKESTESTGNTATSPRRGGRKATHKEEVEEEDSSSDDDDDDDDESEEEEMERKELPKRSTRGRRTKQLMEDEADQEFWSQDAWKEYDEGDEDICSDDFSSDAFGDSSDSDIELDEQAELEQEEEERRQQAEHEQLPPSRRRKIEERDDYDDSKRKKKSRYVDPALAPTRRRAAVTSTTTTTVPKVVAPVLPAPDRALRDSTKSHTLSVTKAIEREAALKKTKKPQQQVEQQPKERSRLTHQEMLESAARTELQNKRALATMIMVQEETKKRKEESEMADADKGLRIIYKSTKAGNQYIFSDPTMFPKAKISVIGKVLRSSNSIPVPHEVQIPPPGDKQLVLRIPKSMRQTYMTSWVTN